MALIKLSMPDYLSAPGISKSGLDQIAKSPAHYQAWKAEQPEPTKAMMFGSAVHCALLEPELFAGAYAVSPEVDRRTKDGKAEYAAWEAANGGKVALSMPDYSKILAMRDSFQSHSLTRGTVGASVTEHSLLWTDEKTGAQCKARPDIVLDGMVMDLKTTEDASPRAFERSAANFRYHCQAAFYLRAMTADTGILHTKFLFIAIEKTPPYAIAVYEASPDMIRMGADCNNADLARYAKAKTTGVWDSYPETVQQLSLPPWAL